MIGIEKKNDGIGKYRDRLILKLKRSGSDWKQKNLIGTFLDTRLSKVTQSQNSLQRAPPSEDGPLKATQLLLLCNDAGDECTKINFSALSYNTAFCICNIMWVISFHCLHELSQP